MLRSLLTCDDRDSRMQCWLWWAGFTGQGNGIDIYAPQSGNSLALVNHPTVPAATMVLPPGNSSFVLDL
jgi:hypothetical protein